MGCPAHARPDKKRGSRARWWLKIWHRWFGLGAALWLFLLALTGSAIAFYAEIDGWLNPDWRSVPAATVMSGHIAADRAIASAHRSLPGFTPRMVNLPDRPGDTIMMVGSTSAGPVQLFADPRDGATLGWRTSGKLIFDRRHFIDTLYGLHMDLMLGHGMEWFLGLVALLWVLDHIPAAILAVPKLAKWRTAFRVQGRGFNLRRLYDLHRAPGLWFYPVTLMLAVTGLCLTWQEEARTVVSLFSPVSGRIHYTFPDHPPPLQAIGLDAAIAIAERRVGQSTDSVTLLPRKGVYGVRLFDARDLDGLGRLWVYVRMTDGQVMAIRHDNGRGAGDSVFAWLYPLHSGKALGVGGRVIISLAGLATLWLIGTGVVLYSRRRGFRSAMDPSQG